MTSQIILKETPRIEVQLVDEGIQIIDDQTKRNSGFYVYSELHSIKLNKVWFIKVAKWLRVITWILNGVPLFPDAETCKKASLTIQFKHSKVGIWLSNPSMTRKAKKLKELLESRRRHV